MNVELTVTERFAKQYNAMKASLPGAKLPWLGNLRERALADFMARGLPTPRVEAWKYTNLNQLARLPLVAAKPIENGIAAAAIPRLLTAEIETNRLIFVNGRLRRDLSTPGELPARVVFGGLAETLDGDPAILESRLGAFGAGKDTPLAALNTAFMADGFLLRIPADVWLDRPIELVFITLAGREPGSHHTRNLILAERGSRAVIVEHHFAVAEGAYFANGVTEIELEAGAVLQHYKFQSEGSQAFHIANRRVRVEQGGSYDSFVIANGSRLARDEISMLLNGSGANGQLNGAFMARGRQLIDNTTMIDHAKPNTTSREIYKGVLDDQARGVFQGRILVRPDAQKTDGQQTSRTLLLSPGAEIDTKPQLEIYADDVKCSHGATAGELEEESLFYLRSRGIPEPEARQMLVEAFLDDVVDRIAYEPLRDAFRGIVAGWIGPKIGGVRR